ncbi:MAG: LysR family transcriptional regulator [Paracoccus sp. (in: a-proteobacteria)]|uniref:LysR family transcriptional regulator n=1 Tax=Paracoccus sp. TaxID=267 RepID=UPI0026E0624C|nr:LysR family transcriptional regulator [Paracoccus sp. (in: a-proteobacteria)]MDO5631615.1 LysR family transcriptional regulator [Paracoccus sp. (in: a-proteobacteria)]
MDTRQLKTLLAIAETGSFSRAADAVHLTASAISQQIQALEYEVGAELFDRRSRPPRLTAAGLQMVEAARELVKVTENAIDAISGRRVTGTLALGSVRTSALSLLPRAIVPLNAAHPELRIKLRVALSEPLLQDVAAGRLDAAMIAEHGNFPAALRWRPFLREPLFVIAPPGTPPQDAETLLARHPYIRFAANVPLAHIIDRELGRMNVRPVEIAEIDTISSIVACVANGLGVSVVPKVAIDDCAHPLVSAPFGTPQVHREIGLIERRNHPRQALVDKLHDLLTKIAGGG